MAYELYTSRYKGYEIDNKLDDVGDLEADVATLKSSYDANKVIMPDTSTLPSYLANHKFDIDVSSVPGNIIEKKSDGYYAAETDLSDYYTSAEVDTKLGDYDTSTEVDTKIAAAAYTLPPATETDLGGVIPDGTTITVDSDGTIHGASAIDNLDDIGDVNVSGATDGQALVYDATNEEWIPGDAGSDSPPEIAIQTAEPIGDEVFWIDPTEGMPVLPDNGRQIISGGELEFYTEDERVIGYWTDGRPIYRRVVSGTSSSESGTWISLVTISNIKDMINIYGFATQADGARIPCNYYRHQSSLTSTSYCATAITSNGSLMFMTKETNMSVKIVMEYTKTTDTAVTNVSNYSTDEIRTNKTWIDGKPIYRKVYNLGAIAIQNGATEINFPDLNKINYLISATLIRKITSSGSYQCFNVYFSTDLSINKAYLVTNDNMSATGDKLLILEYTKSTD